MICCDVYSYKYNKQVLTILLLLLQLQSLQLQEEEFMVVEALSKNKFIVEVEVLVAHY
jgi:hypothetical protein